MKQKKNKSNRKRPIVFNFRVSHEEYLSLQALILLSGKKKAEFLIDSLLKQKVEVIGGKFASDRISNEIKKLRESLAIKVVPSELKDLLEECRELVCQLISLLK